MFTYGHWIVWSLVVGIWLTIGFVVKKTFEAMNNVEMRRNAVDEKNKDD